jgi:predicted acylesterase/phospholipase RssA
MVATKKTLGLALSGSGNRSSFYVGFLEVLTEKGIKVDYLAATSGGSLVSASFACGTLEEFKNWMLNLDSQQIQKFIEGKTEGRGLYSLEHMEEKLRSDFTNGQNFEDIKPHMSFLTVDIESGEIVDLCMGDIAKAACASCVLPGIFSPVVWGNRTLVDGGILSQVPVYSLKKFEPDVIVGINMRGTKHVFSPNLINLKKVFNFFKKILFVDDLKVFLHTDLDDEENSLPKLPGLLSILGKSLDVVIKAENKVETEDAECDLLIIPKKLNVSRNKFSKKIIHSYYYEGRKCAEENLEKIINLLK